MIHYAIESALISMFVILAVPACVAVAIFLGTSSSSANSGEEAMSNSMGSVVVYALGVFVGAIAVIINYAWGGWW